MIRKQYAAAGIAVLMAAQLLTGCGQQSAKPQETESSQKQEEQTSEARTSESETQGEQATESQTPEESEREEGDLFTFTRENFPKMDGSTSLAPLATAVASVLLGETAEQVEDLVDFHKTTQSYRNLMAGDCSLIFASEPNPTVFTEMEEAGFEYDMEAISTEGLIFVVNADNPVDNLTKEQVQKIYAGEITNWKEVGGEDLEIAPFQRNSGAGSQALLEKLVMKDYTLMEAPEEYLVGSMDGLMAAVKSYDNSSNAIGYSVYYYANDMKMAEGLKIISIDGVTPEPKTIREGTYPYTNAYYCAIAKASEEGSPERIIYDWIVSEDGQRLLAEEGYVSVMDLDQ